MERQSATIRNVTHDGGLYFVDVTLSDGGELDRIALYLQGGSLLHPASGDACLVDYPDDCEDNPIALLPQKDFSGSTEEGDAVLFDDHGNVLQLASGGVTLNSTALKPFVIGGTGAGALCLADALYSVFNALVVPAPETGLKALQEAMKTAFAPTGAGVTQTVKGK